MRNIRPNLRLWIPAILATLALAVCVFAAGRSSIGPKTVVVTITPANPPSVSPDPAVISKGEGDQVEWVCPRCTSGFRVHFPKGSPFSDSSFGPGHAKSGATRANAAVHLYHYAVTAKGHTTDPGVKITP